MRRLLLLALLVPLVSGCGWLRGFTGTQAPPATHRGFLGPVVSQPTHVQRDAVPRWVKLEHLPRKAIRGAVLFESAGCTACHTYAGTGSRNLKAPPLTAIGKRHLGIRFQIAHLKCPSCVTPGSPMPPFASLGRKRLRQIAIFLAASKGIR